MKKIPIKRCSECGGSVFKDRKSGKLWCPICKEIREDFDGRLRIVCMGKNGGKKKGRANFINCMARELRKLGHEVITLSDDYLYKIIPQYDFTNCIQDKKPINIKQIEYEYNPDFIYIEQMYYRLNVDEITCPVIYQHREYTHFPDIINPDILLASYHWRLRAFEFCNPYEYSKIQYKDYMNVAVDTDAIKPVENKTLEGVYHIGTHVPMIQFRQANGPVGDMVMEQQEIFWNKCIEEGYVGHIPDGLSGPDFIKMLGRCEALLYDAGRFGGVSRRLVEAMASKTLCVIKIRSGLQKHIYKEMGLTEEMCFFVDTPEDVNKVKFTEKERKEMVDKAYDWIITNHTYEVRVKQLIKCFEEFQKGVKKGARFMGWALKHNITVEDGGTINVADEDGGIVSV